jgi:hypothetical protein
MGSRFQIAKGTVPKEEPEPVQAPINIPNYRELLDVDPEINRSRDTIMRALGVPEEIISNQVPHHPTPPTPYVPQMQGPYLRPRISDRPIRNPQLIISAPGGNQVVIPLRDIIARIQPHIGIDEFELVIRMSRRHAEVIMYDIYQAQAGQGIPTPREGA